MEPSVIGYRDTQRDAADSTVAEEEQQLRRRDQEKRKQLYEKSRPSAKELSRVSAVSALAEGGTAFCMGIYRKRRAGKKLSSFDADDWKELGMDTAGAGAKGGVRGAVVYGMTNFTATPAEVASSLVTAAFGVAAEAGRLKAGAIDKDEFFIRSEVYCLDATVSAVSSILGSVIIPVPILGAVIGNMTGMFLYEIAKTAMSEEEQKTIQQYRQNKLELDEALVWQYRAVMSQVEADIKEFDSLVEWAFSEMAHDAFAGSVKLAEHCGVRRDAILRSRQDVEKYFTE